MSGGFRRNGGVLILRFSSSFPERRDGETNTRGGTSLAGFSGIFSVRVVNRTSSQLSLSQTRNPLGASPGKTGLGFKRPLMLRQSG